jgi:hypothetical protein
VASSIAILFIGRIIATVLDHAQGWVLSCRPARIRRGRSTADYRETRTGD